MTIKAAFFDLDGVAFDTEPQYSIFWGGVCRQYHPEEPGLENKIKGQTLTQIFDAHFPEPAQQRDIVKGLDAYEAQMSYDYVPGFFDYVQSLREKGLKTALVTSSNQPKMKAVFAARPEFRNLFDAILTSEDFSESKPSPECYLMAARRFGLTPAECMVFEDSFNGLKSARAAEMTVVGLSTTNPASAIRDLCDVIVADFQDVTTLESILNNHPASKV